MAAATAPATRPDTPQPFRLSLEVGDLDRAIAFYSELFDIEGHRQAGARCYFDCGPVTLSVLDASTTETPHAAAKAVYFTVDDLEAVFTRAEHLGCLSAELVHDQNAGAIIVRPWGERSFYADDPWDNPLCFVERGTVYAG